MTDITFYHEDIYKGNLILVNKAYPLFQNVTPNLLPAHDNYSNIYMEIYASKLLSHLMAEVKCNDKIIPVSGFRTCEEQSRIYDTSMADNGIEFTESYVAPPNHSEHQSGLAIDLAMKEANIDFIRPHFPYEGICNEFRKIAPYYGFIERYPQGKENITGIAHEPWHFRYVGFPHSKLITDQGISLEEYIENLKTYRYGKKHLFTEHHNQLVEIFYVYLRNSYSVRIGLTENILYQVSGNNVDGVIVTLWRKKNE